jgi:hypothetical protein
MAKAVLPHALHAADDSKGGAASDALKEMLKEAGGEEEAAVIRCVNATHPGPMLECDLLKDPSIK